MRVPEHADQRSGLLSITIPQTELIHGHPAPLTRMRQRQVLHLDAALTVLGVLLDVPDRNRPWLHH